MTDNLLKKGIATNFSCSFCRNQLETTCHLMWEIKVSKKVWNVFVFPSNINVFPVGMGSWSSCDYWECLKVIDPKQQLGKVLNSLWSIWKQRYAFHFNQGLSYERSIIQNYWDVFKNRKNVTNIVKL